MLKKFMVSTLCASVLAACGGSSSTPTESNEVAKPNPAPQPQLP